MNCIVNAKESVYKIWGDQSIINDEVYRLMKYTMLVNYNEIMALHNNVTGETVILNEQEIRSLEKLPMRCDESIHDLIQHHFLVPVDYDEHEQVIKIRAILRRIDALNRPKDITLYTILPTTACNARCYYCFEQGFVPITMTEETANDVVKFICKSCHGNAVNITWFGGEPTVGARRIDQISEGLRANGVKFQSNMITNGYLFDENMVHRAKQLWNLRYLQISFDGTELNYNKTKNYIGVTGSPYKRLLHNIELLLKENIGVNLRMNFDLYNYRDFYDLVEECKIRFNESNSLNIYAYPVIGEYENHDGEILHGSDDWLRQTEVDLNNYARTAKVFQTVNSLPSLSYGGCEADNNSSITITPEGNLVRCCEVFSDDQVVGDIYSGITNSDLYNSWKSVADYQLCRDCRFFPTCVKLVNCVAKDNCYSVDRLAVYEASAKRVLENYVSSQE